MNLVIPVALVAVVALGIGFYAGTQVGDRPPSRDVTTANGLDTALERMTRAVERLEAQIEGGPSLATRPDVSPADPDRAKIAEMLAGIAERLDRLNAGGPPESSRERGPEKDERLRSLTEGEPDAHRRKHFMWTGRDLLERYGVPDNASYWSGMTVRWVYKIQREAPYVRAVFELTDGYVTQAFVERGS